MRIHTKLCLLSVMFLALAPLGCVPSDAQIDAEMSASRREAYLEWTAKRDRGQTAEIKMEGPLSLDDAVKVALQYNKILQMALQEREITRGDRISEYSIVLPSVGLAAGTGHREGDPGGYFDHFSYGFTVSQNLLDASIPPRLRMARLNTALTDEGIRSQVQDLISSVANTYYDVLLGQQMVEVYRESLISAETQYRMVAEKKKQETATDYDVLRAQVDVATYRANMQNAMNDVDTNRVALLKYMGASQDSEITFSDKLEFLPMRPVFERAVEIAAGLRPDLRQAELNYRLEQEAVRIARSQFIPTLGATFTQTWSQNTNRNSFGRRPWNLDFGASVNYGIDSYGGLVSAKARAKQQQINILDVQETTIKEIRQYMNSLANAEETVKALVVNQDAAREALRLVLVGYQAGVKTEVDVTDARKALTDVMGQYYNALTNHTKARLNLQIAMGVLGPTCITDAMPTKPNVPIANITEFAATDYVPPQPIPMPSASDVNLNTPRVRPEPPAAQARPAPLPAPVASTPVMAPVPVPAPVPTPVVAMPAPAPTPMPAPAAQPALSGMIMPPPPGAAPAAPPAIQTAAPQAPVQPVVAPATRPEEPKPQPLFRITTRENLPEVARARQ